MALRALPLPPLNPLSQALPQGPPTQSLPTLWSQLEPFRRQELAQHLAEMIHRLRLQVHPPLPSTGPSTGLSAGLSAGLSTGPSTGLSTERPRQEAANDHR